MNPKLKRHSSLVTFFFFFKSEPYLFKVVSQKDKVDTAESQLRDDQEEVHNVPADGEGKNTKIRRIKRKIPREIGV